MSFIRRANEADAFRLAEIEVFSYRLDFYPIFRTDDYFFSELNVPVLIDEYRAEPERVANALVYDDGIIKGFIRVNGKEVEKLFVELAFRGRGIGGALLDKAASELGASYLLVLEKNLAAIRFYERHGFLPTGEKHEVDGTGNYLIRVARK